MSAPQYRENIKRFAQRRLLLLSSKQQNVSQTKTTRMKRMNKLKPVIFLIFILTSHTQLFSAENLPSFSNIEVWTESRDIDKSDFLYADQSGYGFQFSYEFYQGFYFRVERLNLDFDFQRDPNSFDAPVGTIIETFPINAKITQQLIGFGYQTAIANNTAVYVQSSWLENEYSDFTSRVDDGVRSEVGVRSYIMPGLEVKAALSNQDIDSFTSTNLILNAAYEVYDNLSVYYEFRKSDFDDSTDRFGLRYQF